MKRAGILKMLLFAIASVIVMSAAVMWLWNWLIPSIFAGPAIGFIQAAGLLLLARILFRGFVGMHYAKSRRCSNWNEKWEKMTPEQKEKMRELWKKRCGGYSCKSEDSAEKQE